MDAAAAPDDAAALESKLRTKFPVCGSSRSCGCCSRRCCGLRVEEATHRSQTACGWPQFSFSRVFTRRRRRDCNSRQTCDSLLPENEAAPADNAQPATGTPLADAASATGFLHSRLLSSEIGRRFRSDIRLEADLVEYQVAWEKPLGKGTFGTVYPGIASGVAQKAVAIKLFESGHVSEQAAKAVA